MKTTNKGEKRRYVYSGPVLKFGAIVANDWRGSTFAASERQATNNLVYQFKRQYGMVANVNISLAGAPAPIG